MSQHPKRITKTAQEQGDKKQIRDTAKYKANRKHRIWNHS